MEDHEEQCAESYLPLDIVGGILSRLPVKSLIRFRSVCKPWRFLIDDANFAKEQHVWASPALICPYHIVDSRIILYDFDGPECDIMERVPQLEFKELAACDSLSNSVNGLICGYSHPRFYYEQKYCLLNPSTRTLVQVPGPNLSQKDSNLSLGLGFDVSTGNYKLVLLSHSHLRPDACSCFVLTVGCDNEWRYVGDAPSLFPLWQPVFVEGVLNWITYLREKEERVILAFHLKEEKFHNISIPNSELLTYGLYLSNCREHLCLSGSSEECLSIWKLDDYTSQKWTREYHFDFPPEISTSYYFPGLVAIKGDKFVLNCTDLSIDFESAKVMVFDNVRRSLKCYSTKSLPVVLYTESLVCPRNLVGLEEVV